jgi:chemotaxis protein MotA
MYEWGQLKELGFAMLTPLFGLVLLCGVFVVALSQQLNGKISFFDYHAGIVVFGGVFAALCLAVDYRALNKMLHSVLELLPFKKSFARSQVDHHRDVESMRSAWLAGQRSKVLELSETSKSPEVRQASDALINKIDDHAASELFMKMRIQYICDLQPQIEGWDLVARLAPSFGMVGTVTGMVQLFRNMGENSGNMGGAMAMALLATLYGIAFGSAVGGPMASRLNNHLNEKLAGIDLLEKTVASLMHRGR